MKDEHGNKTPTCSPDLKCRGQERRRHVKATIEWLANFREREPSWYHAPEVKQHAYEQLSWLDGHAEGIA